jgi:hypothetical protein
MNRNDLSESQKNALKLIERTGRSTDKRAVNGLAAKKIVMVTRENRLSGSWGKKGAMAYYCIILNPATTT